MVLPPQRRFVRWLSPLLVGAALLARPERGFAQQVDWDNYCVGGALQFCASVELTLNDLGGQTAMTVRVRNLEGTQGSVPWGMYELGFMNLRTYLNGGGNLDATIATSGTARAVPIINANFCAQLFAPKPCPNLDSLAAAHTQEWDYGGNGNRGSVAWTWSGSPWDAPVAGCDLPGPQGSGFLVPPWSYLQTCGGGWVTYSIVLVGDWSFDDQSSMRFFEGYGGTRADCDPNIWNCDMVSPEPGTVVLLATGMAGVVATRRRRRAAPSPGASSS